MVNLRWKGALTFEVLPPSGFQFFLDNPEEGKRPKGPSPMETLLSALAGCAAMDVISILEKKRQMVEDYQIQIEGDRPPQGEWPRPYKAIRVRHLLRGAGLDPAAIQRAVELSTEKYCSVLATLREMPPVTTDWEIVEEDAVVPE